MTRILMVCLGNICRSPLAHGILESKLPADKFSVDSAGTGDYHIGKAPDHRSIATAKTKGLDISQQKCRQFEVSDFDHFDIIYVMDRSNLQNVLNLARNKEDEAKVKMILDTSATDTPQEVPDPYWGSMQDFEDVYTVLDEVCETIAQNLKKS